MNKIEIKGLHETIYEGVCDNGLRVYIWVNEKVKSTFMSLSVKYGSIDTEFKKDGTLISVPNGTAHFIEHIKFNEPNDLTAHDFYKKSGADVNAFTTFKYTSYLVYAMNNVGDNLNHLLDFVQTPYFNNKMIQKEKGIIIEEANMGFDDPSTVGYFGMFKSIFKESKYRNLVTGSPDEIKNISLEDINNVYDNFYVPQNMFLSITGNVNPYEIFEIVEKNQRSKEFNNTSVPEIVVPKEPKKVNEEYKRVEAKIKVPNCKIALKMPRKVFKDYSDLEIKTYLNLILNINFGSTSDFKNDLEQNKLIAGLGTNAAIYDDYIIMMISFDSRFPDEVVKIVNEKLDNLELNEKDFIRKIRATLATLILGYDDIESVNYKIQDNIVDYNYIINDMKLFYDNIKYEDVLGIKKLINANNKTVYIMEPTSK